MTFITNRAGAEVPCCKMGNRHNDKVCCQLPFFLLLCFLVVEVFFHSISYFKRNISKKNFCFRDHQTPNKSFMKLFGYISGANEVTSKQPTHLSIKTWQMVFTKLTNTFFKGWGEDFHDSASVNQSYQCWGWRWLSAKVDLPGVCLI